MILTNTPGLTDLVPSEFYLGQNYPNPFSDKTTIKLCVAYKAKVKLDVFDTEGKLVRQLMDEEKEAGTYEVEFDACNLPTAGQGLSEGVYVYQLRVGDFISTKQMTLRR